MDDKSPQQKSIEREIVVYLVAKELTYFAKEAGIAALEGFETGKVKFPDTLPWARKIISLIKEHSL